MSASDPPPSDPLDAPAPESGGGPEHDRFPGCVAVIFAVPLLPVSLLFLLWAVFFWYEEGPRLPPEAALYLCLGLGGLALFVGLIVFAIRTFLPRR